MSLGNPGDPRLLDATALKAYTHPLRLRMLRYLNDHEAATATELARHLGESTGQTSYHLRQLARHGLVVEDAERGTGRERWWKAVSTRLEAGLRDDPAMEPALTSLLRDVVEGRAETLRQWFRQARDAPPEWVEAAATHQVTTVLTPAEVAELNAAIGELAERYVTRARERGDQHPPDARRVRIYYDVVPLSLGET